MDEGAAARPVWIVCLLAAVTVAGVMGWDIGQHLASGLTNHAGEQLGRDFSYFWSGAHLAVSGAAARIYDILDFFRFERSVFGAHAEFRFYGYPPIFLLITAPFGFLPYVPAFALWLGGGVVVCAALLARRIGWSWALPLSVGAPASFINFYSGQNGQLSAILLAGGLMALEERPILAGLAFGLLGYKPHLGILLPVALIAAGKWRTMAAAAVTVTMLVAVSILCFGTQSWIDFLRETSLQRMLLDTESMNWPRMPTWFAGLRLLGAGVTVAYDAQIVSGLAAAAAIAALWRSAAPRDAKYAGLILGIFLVTPYGWDYDMVVVTFAVVWLITSDSYWAESRLARLVILLLIGLPLVGLIAARLFGVPIAPVILWLGLAMILRRGGALAAAAAPRSMAVRA